MFLSKKGIEDHLSITKDIRNRVIRLLEEFLGIKKVTNKFESVNISCVLIDHIRENTDNESIRVIFSYRSPKKKNNPIRVSSIEFPLDYLTHEIEPSDINDILKLFMEALHGNTGL